MESKPLHATNAVAALAAVLIPAVLAAHDAEEVHPAITRNAIDIAGSALVSRFADEVIRGAREEAEDECGHAFNPVTGRGYPEPVGCGTAIDRGKELWDLSVAAYRAGSFTGDEGAFRRLGRLLHVLQDLTCPAHVHSDPHPAGDDFETWAEENFEPLEGIAPSLPDGSIEEVLRQIARRTYDATTFQGEIVEASQQPESTLLSMFPSLDFVEDFVDSHWAIDDIGTFDHLVFPDRWEPGAGDFSEDEGGPAGSRRIRGNFYIRNAGGTSGKLTPAIWNNRNNTKTLLENYGDTLFPEAVKLSAGLLRRFDDTVCEPPAAALSASLEEGCAPLEVAFDDRSTGPFITAWSWDFGDGSKSSEQKPKHTYEKAGTYEVKLTVQGDCGSDTAELEDPVLVLAGARASFSAAPRDGCAPLSVKFRDASTGDVSGPRAWDFGDGAKSQEAEPTHVYAAPGKYTVTLSLSGACGGDSETRKDFIEVFGASVPDFKASAVSGCPRLEVKFTDASRGAGISSWKWTFGDGGGSTQRNPSHIYSKAGTYSVGLAVNGECGGGSVTKDAFIRIKEPSKSDFTASPQEGCPPLEVQFTDKSSGDGLDTWQWDFGDSTKSGEKSPVHVYKSPGKYAVSLRVEADCGSNQTVREGFIQVFEPAAPAFQAGVLEGCAPLEVKFTDRSKGEGLTSWSWDFGDGATSQERNPMHAFATKGEFPVVLKVLGKCGGELSSLATVIRVSGVPDPPAAVTNPPGAAGAAFEGDVISIEWPPVEAADAYIVEAMVTGKDGWFEACEPGKGRLSCRRLLDASGEWKFRVTAVNECGKGGPREGKGITVTPAPVIASWPLDCDPGAITPASVRDVARGHDGKVSGAVICAEDRFGLDGKAHRFDGGGAVEGDLPAHQADFSLGFWLSPAKDASKDQEEVVLGLRGDDPPPLLLSWIEDGGILRLAARRNASAVDVPGLDEGAWHHVVVTRSLGNVTLIVDGEAAGSRKDTLSLPGGFVMGGAPGAGGLHGTLDGALYEARARNASEAIDLALSDGPSLHVFPSEPKSALTAPRAVCEVLRIRFLSGSKESVVIDDARFRLEDISDPALGPPPGFGFLDSGTIAFRPDCQSPIGEIEVGSLAIKTSSPGVAAVAADLDAGLEIEPVSEGCLVALFDIGKDAPVGRTFRGSLEKPGDLEVSGLGGEKGFVLGRQLAGRPAVEGDGITVRAVLPPVLVLESPAGVPVAIPGKLPLRSAELHRAILAVEGQGGPRDAVAVKRVVYSLGGGFDLLGVENPVVFLSLGGKADPGVPVAQGTVDRAARAIRFENLPVEIAEDTRVTLILRADLKRASPAATAVGAAILPLPVPPAGPRALAVALLAALAVLALLRKPAARPRKALLAACAAGAILIAFTGGCGGGGGGGGSAATGAGELQTTIRGASDLDASSAADGAPATVLVPLEGIRGPLYQLR